jgi:signal transduction histidine kinase/CheY-like chemotaxis protein/sensor domain CHASE-containing protein
MKRIAAAAFAVASAGVILGTAYLLQRDVAEREAAGARTQLRAEVNLLAGRLELALNQRLLLVRGLDAFVRSRPAFSEAEFESFAHALEAGQNGIMSLQLAPDGVITFITNKEANKAVLGHNLLTDPRRRHVSEETIKSREINIAGPIELIQGGQAVIARMPIFLPTTPQNDKFWGFATVLIDLQVFLKETGTANGLPNAAIAIRGKDGKGVDGALIHGDAATFEDATVRIPVSLPHGTWVVGASSTGATSVRDLRYAIWILGALLAALAGAALYTALRRPEKLRIAVEEATRELIESRQRFADFAEASSDWRWEMGPDMRFTYLSGRVEVVTGIPAKYHYGKTREELSGESLDSEKWRDLTEAIRERRPFRNFEYHRVGPDGKTQYISTSGKPVFGEDGAFLGYRGTGTDVSDRNAALDRARVAEQRLLTAINALEDGFVLYDADDRLVLCNEKYREIYKESADLMVPGAKFEDMLRKGAECGQYPEAVGRVDAWLEERLRQHREAAGDVEQRLPGGRWFKISERRTPDGGIVGFRVDITQLKRAAENAEAANRAKSAFLATMSHEIRTPMTGVMGFADMLLEDDIPPVSREKVERIKDSTRSLLRILNDILDVSKLDAGKMEIEGIDFHLPSLIENVVNMFTEINAERAGKNLRFETRFADGFPTGVNSDPTRLRQILVNLVGNAAKFTSEGSVTLTGAVVKAGDGRDMIEIRVTDSGIGIPDELQPYLFTDFTQADASTSRRFEGTGLGLAICKRLVGLMGGEIGCESHVGEGSTFWFTLPLVPATTDVDASGIAPPQKAHIHRAVRPLHILVAEDNDINRRIIGAVIESFGHTYEMVTNGVEAVAAVAERRFDLVLMDVRMPELSGPEATRQIRNTAGAWAHVPVIALTADAMEEHRAGYFAAGMDGVATKPIDRAQLAELINDVLGERIHVTDEVEPTPADPQKAEVDAANLAAVDAFLKKIDSGDA